MSFPLATEARTEREPEDDSSGERSANVPRLTVQNIDAVQQFFVEWEVPQAS